MDLRTEIVEWLIKFYVLSSTPYGIGYMRRHCDGHRLGSSWLLLLELKTGGAIWCNIHRHDRYSFIVWDFDGWQWPRFLKPVRHHIEACISKVIYLRLLDATFDSSTLPGHRWKRLDRWFLSHELGFRRVIFLPSTCVLITARSCLTSRLNCGHPQCRQHHQWIPSARPSCYVMYMH